MQLKSFFIPSNITHLTAMKSFLLLLFIALYEQVLGQQIQSKFSEKCHSFKRPALFFNQSCFIATDRSHTTSDTEWIHLHSFCNHLPTFRHRLAFVYTPEQIKKLVERNVVKPNVSLFVGSRKIQPANCGKENCDGCPDPEQFFYVDAAAKYHSIVNPQLWLRKQPDNKGPNRQLPERIVALEHANRFGGGANQVGLNDVDGQNQNFPLLCEYKDNAECPKNMTLMADGICIGMYLGPKTPSEAIDFCHNITNGVDSGTMPSIHDDETNTFLANLARTLITKNKWNDGRESGDFEQYWPVMFGMVFDNKRWVNLDGKPTDYFRWWSLENKEKYNLYENPTKGQKHVFLMVRTNGANGVPTFGYWGNVFHETQKIPFFFCSIKQLKTNLIV